MILIKIGGEISGNCSGSKNKVERIIDWFMVEDDEVTGANRGKHRVSCIDTHWPATCGTDISQESTSHLLKVLIYEDND